MAIIRDMKSIAAWLRAAAAASLFALAACSGTKEPDTTFGWTPERLYAAAKEEMAMGNWAAAIKQLERLEARYPFGKWAQQAQIELAYAHYRDNERALALATIDRFLKLYPDHPALDYVYYLKGLVNFNEQEGFMARLGGQDLAERDLQAAREAFDAFKVVVTRFPESKYAADAEARMRYLVNAMATGQVRIARYYFMRGAYVAAANRAQEVVRQYQQAAAVEEALYILWQSYDRLGLVDLRDDTARVLERNFPQSELMRKGLTADDRRWWQVWR